MNIEKAKPGEHITSALALYGVLVVLAGSTNKSLKDGEYVETIVEAVASLGKLPIKPLALDDIARAVNLVKT
ncbi:MAG: hypothetical protein ACP5KA_07485 [Desulfurococcaceae archaeon]